MTKTKREILGALLLYGRSTICSISNIVNRNDDTVRKTLKMFYDEDICDRDMFYGTLTYGISEAWIDKLWISYD